MSLAQHPTEERILARDGDGVVDLSGEGTYDLSRYERDVKATVNTANGTLTINLPPVGEAKGLIFTVICTTAANSKHIYVLAHSESSLGAQDGDDPSMPSIDLDTTADYAVLYSNGRRWFVLASEMA